MGRHTVGRLFIIVVFALLLQACKHPLVIVGEGDIVELTGTGRGCSLEQFRADDPACTDNEVFGDYSVRYEARPRPGWQFVRWEGSCKKDTATPTQCSLDVPGRVVSRYDAENPGKPIKPATAVFERFAGIASYRKLELQSNPITPYTYHLTLEFDAFESAQGIPVTIDGLITEGHLIPRVNVPELSFGTQLYTVTDVSCSAPTSQTAYDGMLLIDRSVGLSRADPTDQTLVGAAAFVRGLGPEDRARVAQFPGEKGDAIDFLTDFTGDQAALSDAINSVKPAASNAPLWDAMSEALRNFDGTSDKQRALLTLSTGDGRVSATGPSDVFRNAFAISLPVYAMNLNNADSSRIDNIALRTGGSVFSTQEPGDLADYYGALGQIVSGQSIPCKLEIDVGFLPSPGVTNDIGFGPALPTKLTLELAASTGDSIGIATSEVLFPLYPSARVGSSNSTGRTIYQTDNSSAFNADACIVAGANTVGNQCTDSAVYFRACGGGSCTGGILQPGATAQAPPSPTYRACFWLDAPMQYVPVSQSGMSPNILFALWQTPGAAALCSYAARHL